MEACKLSILPAVKLYMSIVEVKCLKGAAMQLGPNNAAVVIYVLLVSLLATAAL